MTPPLSASGNWTLMLSAAAILMIIMGARQSLGLFVAPIGQATHMGIVDISFAPAVRQLVWGLMQPVFGDENQRGRNSIAS